MLQEVVSESGLAGFAQVALVLFFISFVAVIVGACLSPRRQIDQAARLPLEEAPGAAKEPNHG